MLPHIGSAERSMRSSCQALGIERLSVGWFVLPSTMRYMIEQERMLVIKFVINERLRVENSREMILRYVLRKLRTHLS